MCIIKLITIYDYFKIELMMELLKFYNFSIKIDNSKVYLVSIAIIIEWNIE